MRTSDGQLVVLHVRELRDLISFLDDEAVMALLSVDQGVVAASGKLQVRVSVSGLSISEVIQAITR